MVTRMASPFVGKSADSAGELDEYEDVQGDTKLEDWFCGGEGEEWRYV